MAVDVGVALCDNCRMSTTSIVTVLRQAIVASGLPYLMLERETGVDRTSIQRFVDGRRSLRLDMADRLAAFFELELVGRRKE
jgi:plasmid maintenance system antidote protein VapI